MAKKTDMAKKKADSAEQLKGYVPTRDGHTFIRMDGIISYTPGDNGELICRTADGYLYSVSIGDLRRAMEEEKACTDPKKASSAGE